GDQQNWRSNVPNYAKVAEKNVYPGIDLVYYGTQRQLEYDFNVAPGADPKAIQISFEGARKLRVDAAGNLILGLAGGEVKFEKPFAYQMKGDEKDPVAARFHLGDRKYRVYFAIDNYDATRPLVIDPILAYSTYLGGSDIDGANAIAVAPDNTAFVAGGTFSTNFPVAHALQPNDGGNLDFPQDAFVTKISADGSTLLYSTYLGGKNQDVANGIAVDAAGEAYVAGSTLSPDFPTNPGQSWDTLCGGDGKCGASFNAQGLIVSNGFLAKINAAGSGIIYSGFIGAFEDVTANAVAVDGNENAYVTGQVGPNGFATAASGGTPLVLDILASPNGAIPNGDGTSTIHVTTNIVLPINQLVAIAGVGGTTANPNPPSPFDGSFIVLSSAPGSFVIATAGGPADGNGTVTVNTAPPFPITPTAFEPHFGGATTDAYVIKINSTGSGILYSSYVGGESEDVGNGIAVDKNNDAYITGLTDSVAFPTTGTAFQPATGGNGDAFFAEVNTNGSGPSSLLYSTFLGGSGLDQGNAIAIDAAGDAFIAGGTGSRALGTDGAFQTDCTLDGQSQCEG
ncbi:MAG TPA: SBBP repeat-containing protein, partial [Candidatus Acidoferrales bacterium]|nr:SBBP repeat-containing protein [Candidatus Acidoferrales bacterium]